MANKTKVIITFYLVGTNRSYYAAMDWVRAKNYFIGHWEGCDFIALQKNKIPKEWQALSDTEKANIDGIMYSENFKEGAVTINIYK